MHALTVAKIFRFIRLGAVSALAAFVVIGCTPLAYLYARPLMEVTAPSQADAIVLMSSGQLTPVWLTPDATQRLAGALQLYRNGFARWIITSGSNRSQGIDQAELEAEWLVLAGVPRDHIIVENQSKRTYESVQQLALLMKHRGFTTLTIVTSEMDVPRVRLTALKFGLKFSYTAVPEFPPPRGLVYFPAGFGLLYHATYEYAGMALYKWNGWI